MTVVAGEDYEVVGTIAPSFGVWVECVPSDDHSRLVAATTTLCIDAASMWSGEAIDIRQFSSSKFLNN